MTAKTRKTAQSRTLTLEKFNMSDKTQQTMIFNNIKWMNSEEASAYLSTSLGSIRNMVYRGQLPAKKLGNRLRFKKIDLDRLLDSFPTKKGI